MKKTIQKCTAILLAAVMLCIFPDHTQAAVNLADFPASYQPYIKQLAAAHPNWNLQAYHTGVSWDDFFAYEKQIGVNLVEEGYVPDYWLSKAQNVTYNNKYVNLYNFSTGAYYVISAPNWVQPTDSVIAYYMDPRNFLNEMDVFMFKHMIYNSAYHSEQIINSVLKWTWMENATLEDNPQMTYAQAFLNIGKELGISPFLLASRIVQEQGSTGGSPLISGAYPGYEGYYNYFNIQASGQTKEEIYKNGMEEAKAAGWNTRYKALYGGAEKIRDMYFSRKQTAVYFQKFDVAGGKVSWRQYMQNIQAPLHESQRVRNTYAEYGMLDSPFTFLIPVFDNMPAFPCQITRNEIMGDVNFDGLIDAKDSLMVLRNAVKQIVFDDVQTRLGNVDGNAVVDPADALMILQYTVRLIHEFPAQS